MTYLVIYLIAGFAIGVRETYLARSEFKHWVYFIACTLNFTLFWPVLYWILFDRNKRDY